MRSFFGLSNSGSGSWGNVEPDTQVNIIGVGAKAGDANYSVMYNDASGTATMIALGSNFPARGSVSKRYELVLESSPNSGIVTLTLTEKNSGNVYTVALSSNIPANTTFLRTYQWVNNGTTASNAAGFNLIEIIGETPL
jgi:hypothetical protein